MNYTKTFDPKKVIGFLVHYTSPYRPSGWRWVCLSCCMKTYGITHDHIRVGITPDPQVEADHTYTFEPLIFVNGYDKYCANCYSQLSVMAATQ